MDRSLPGERLFQLISNDSSNLAKILETCRFAIVSRWSEKGETLLSVSEKFNVALLTVYIVTSKILNKRLNLLNEYIVWPNSVEEFQYIEEGFISRCGYPGKTINFK